MLELISIYALTEKNKLNELTHPFSIKSALTFARCLTPSQKRLFDEVWSHYVDTRTLFPIRSLPRICGRELPESLFAGLNGSLIFETSEQGNRGLYLTIYGSLLTSSGPALAAYLVRLLDWVRELYAKDAYVKEVNGVDVQCALGISEDKTRMLFALLKLPLLSSMPFYLSSWSNNNNSWTMSITDEVMDLYRSEDSATYLDEHLARGYLPDQPWAENDRLKSVLNSQNALTSFSLSTGKMDYSVKRSTPYIEPSRLEELRRIESDRFDCARLICLCEELNECAAAGNAHAVIFLTRAILDHVPPVFGFDNFAQVAANYGGGGRSFKHSLDRLQNQSRHVADRLLHMPIRNRELAPKLSEVSFAPELEGVLAELCRLLKHHCTLPELPQDAPLRGQQRQSSCAEDSS